MRIRLKSSGISRWNSWVRRYEGDWELASLTTPPARRIVHMFPHFTSTSTVHAYSQQRRTHAERSDSQTHNFVGGAVYSGVRVVHPCFVYQSTAVLLLRYRNC